jgi:peptidoglycan/LPS O-acetylase OafA/YrhL
MARQENSDANSTAANGKMECFEGLRGLASVAVLVGHLVIAFWPVLYSVNHPYHANYPKLAGWIASTPARVLIDGQFAVAIFFLLSGFVLSLSFFKTGSFDALSSAAIRRYFRLMIPASVSILFAYAVMKAGWMYNKEATQYMTRTVGFEHQWLGYFYNFTPHLKNALRECYWDTFFGPTALYNQNLWTMSVELAGSFVVYCFLAMFGNLRRRAICYAVVGACLILNNRQYIFDFLVGMAICDLYVSNLKANRKIWIPLPIALALVYASCYLNVIKISGPYKFWWVNLEKRVIYDTVAATILVTTVAFSGTLQKAFQRRIFMFLGKISFALYLVHLVLICSLASGCYLLLRQQASLSHNKAAAIASAACLAASFGLSWLMYLYVDRPAIAIGKYVYVYIFKKSSAEMKKPELSVINDESAQSAKPGLTKAA